MAAVSRARNGRRECRGPEGVQFSIAFSAGVDEFPRHGSTCRACTGSRCGALRAKDAGRGRIFAAETDAVVVRVAELRRAGARLPNAAVARCRRACLRVSTVGRGACLERESASASALIKMIRPRNSRQLGKAAASSRPIKTCAEVPTPQPGTSPFARGQSDVAWWFDHDTRLPSQQEACNSRTVLSRDSRARQRRDGA